jgi:NAD(P)-dependent dehydrogenase (short-subunit alcohol dehydrogenase family)
MTLSVQRILIVGATSGIGRGIALGLADDGARVAVIGRHPGRLEEIAADLAARGAVGAAFGADVTDRDDVARSVGDAAAALGGLDGAVNGAGILDAAGPVGDIDPHAWDRVIATNLTGTFNVMQAEIRVLQRPGWMVNVSSTFGAHLRTPGLAAYAAAKAAVTALTRTAALDHASAGVRINAVSPGPVDTPMSVRPGDTRDQRDRRVASANPSGRVARIEEIVDAVRYLALATYTVGADLVVDGGAAA